MDIVEQLWLECYLSYLDDSCEFGFVPVSFSDYKKSIFEV